MNYNSRDPVSLTQFTWGTVFDGFQFNEDELFNNGIVVNDNVKKQPQMNEEVQLSQLFNESMDALREGLEEQWDQQMHLDGTQDVDSVAGLDHLVSLSGNGVVGGIDASANDYWKNNCLDDN